MLTIKAITGDESYAAQHLSDNHSVGETITGQWMGRGAELLGLQGGVRMEEFEAICQGKHPSTGELLKQRENGDSARKLYDCTGYAPKAVSVMALEDPRVIEAHNAGVPALADEMELLAGARIRKDGVNDTRLTSNLVIARYDHTVSAELDPHIHSHLVAANLTYDGVEGKWKALDARQMYAQSTYLTEVYRNAAAKVLNSLGYEIYQRVEHGWDIGIVGLSEELLQKFSRGES